MQHSKNLLFNSNSTINATNYSWQVVGEQTYRTWRSPKRQILRRRKSLHNNNNGPQNHKSPLSLLHFSSLLKNTVFENHQKCRNWVFKFWHFLLTFINSKSNCELSSLRSQFWMRLFLWFSNIVQKPPWIRIYQSFWGYCGRCRLFTRFLLILNQFERQKANSVKYLSINQFVNLVCNAQNRRPVNRLD